MGLEHLQWWSAPSGGGITSQGWLYDLTTGGPVDEEEEFGERPQTGDYKADRDAANDAADARVGAAERAGDAVGGRGRRRRRGLSKDYFDQKQRRRLVEAMEEGDLRGVEEVLKEAKVPEKTREQVLDAVDKGFKPTVNMIEAEAEAEELELSGVSRGVIGGTVPTKDNPRKLKGGRAYAVTGGTETSSTFGGGDNGVIIEAGVSFDGREGEGLLPDTTEGSGSHFRQGEEDLQFVRGEVTVPTGFYSGLPEREQEWLPTIVAAAKKYGIDPGLLYGLLKQESNFDPEVISGERRSSAGAIGIAQFMPSTAEAYGIDPTNPRQSIFAAAKYLSQYIKHGAQAALVAYNAGPGRMQEFLRTGYMPSETRAYVPNVLGYASGFNPLEAQYSEPVPEAVEPTQVAIELTARSDIEAAANAMGAEILGRAPTEKELAALRKTVHALDRSTQINQAMIGVAQGADAAFGFNRDEWDNYSNGQIPYEVMTEIAPGHYLRPDAAQAWFRMVSAAAADGVALTITDSYRDLDTQERLAAEKGLYSQGGLAAEPGTSNHGWGLALDIDQGREWLAKNGRKFGFNTIAREPWHWEYKPDGGTPTGPTGTFETEQGASLSALIAEELEAMNPQEAAETKLANTVYDFMEIIGVRG